MGVIRGDTWSLDYGSCRLFEAIGRSGFMVLRVGE